MQLHVWKSRRFTLVLKELSNNPKTSTMPKMDGTGPLKEGKQTGRGLGYCNSSSEKNSLEKLGQGMGLRRNSGGGSGQGKRLKSGIQ
jgi:hypothetical protein